MLLPLELAKRVIVTIFMTIKNWRRDFEWNYNQLIIWLSWHMELQLHLWFWSWIWRMKQMGIAKNMEILWSLFWV